MSKNSKTLKVIAGAVFAFAVAFSSTASAAITSNLRQGSRGAQVMELQQFLNNCSAETMVAATGPGSKGMETSYFGPATRRAVIAFQNKFGVATTSRSAGLVGPATRAAIAAGCGTSTGTGSGSTTQTGPVMASLSTTNPSSGTIVIGQATAKLADFTFTGSGTVNSITLKRSGISDQNTLSNVYLYDGATRLTDGYSFNSNGEIMMNNVGLMVSGSRTVSVLADVSSTGAVSGQTIQVAMTSFSSGTTTNTVNLSGNPMSVASGSTLATVSFDSTNTATGTSVQAGSTSFGFWEQKVQVNTRSLWLRGANFRMVGSAPSDAITNIRLFVNGVDTGRVANVTSITGSNYATFDFTGAPIELKTGSSTLSLRGDVSKGSSRTVQFSIQQAADLMMMDPQVGVNVAVTAGTGSIPSSGGNVTISTGSVTASNDTAFNAMTNVTGGASNTTIGKYKVRAYGEDVKVTSLQVLPVLAGMTPAAAGLQNVTVYFNGSQVGTQTASWTSGNITLNLGSQMIIPAGTDSTIEVRADLRTTGGVNYEAGTVSANLVVGSGNAQGQSSFASINTPAVTGKTLSVQTGTLAVSRNPGYASQNLNPNTTGTRIGSFVLQNQSTSESVRVTNLSVAITYGAGTSSTNLSALRTSETSGNGSTPVQPATAAASATGTNSFSVDFTIAPGATRTIDILADVSDDSGATATVVTGLVVTSLGSSSNVSLQQNGNGTSVAGQTIAFRTGTLGTPTLATSSSSVAQLIAAANGGATDGSKAVYNFSSSNAASTITELTFTVSGATTATSVRVGSVTAPVVGGTAYLTGLNINVPNGGSGANVEVFVSYPEVGTSGLASATTSALTLTTVKYSSGNTTTTSTGLTVAAPTMTLVGSMPTYSITDSTETLVNGSVKIAEVTVSANPKGDIRLGQLPVTVTSTGVVTVASAADNIVVKDTSGATIATKNATFAVAAGGSATGIICFDTSTAACASGQAVANGYLIPAGTSKTFRIYVTAATVSGAVNTTSLSAKLGAASSATYYDVAGGSTSAQAATLLNGYPTDTSVISN